MPTKLLADAVREFELALDELTSNLDFVRTATHLRPRLGKMLNWKIMDDEAKKLANGFLDQGTIQESLFYRGMVVVLSGAFEQFMRRIIRNSVVRINKAVASHDLLAEKIRKENYLRTGVAFKTIYEPLDHLNLDYETLAKNIGTCVSGSQDFMLNAEAFTIFMAIVSPDDVSNALRRVGVNLNWDDLGRNQGMRTALGKRDTRETANAIKDFVKNFGQKRNKIAHTGSSGIVITDSEVEQLISVFRVFARTLASLVETQLP